VGARRAELRNGVLLRFEGEEEMHRWVGDMRCHLAYARRHGYEGKSDCPLYLRGVKLEVEANRREVRLLGANAAAAHELKERIGRMVAAAPAGVEP
jgi:hypothetical protein